MWPRTSPTPHPPTDDSHPASKALTTRYALILIMAVVCATAAGAPFWLSSASVPLSVLTGAGVFGASWTFFDRLVA